jgi:predicted nucleic acid-binding protein
MASITLKNIPADLHRELKKRAEENHRSLNGEIIAALKSAVGKTIRLDRQSWKNPFVRPGLCFAARPLHKRSIGGNAKDGCNSRANVICVDTNIIRYRYMASPFSAAADAAWAKDPDWIVPILWRSEFRNALAGSIRKRSLTVEEASAIANLAEATLDRKEFTVSSSAVLQLVSKSNCSVYHCEFVALAHAEGVQLVTADRQTLREFPEVGAARPPK